MHRDLTQEICELIRITSTVLPQEVEKKLQEAAVNETPESAAHAAMETILTSAKMSRRNSIPICQDTGTPIFFVHYPPGMDVADLTKQIRQAVVLATIKTFLRPNAVDALTGKNTGNNLGDKYFPPIFFTQVESGQLTIDLLLKGGGCENVNAQYSLPDDRLKAGRNLEGVRKVVLDAVYQAQGEGCSPGFIGVAIGGDRGTSYAASLEVLLRDLEDENPDANLKRLEEQITNEANQLGIGPMGFGGKSTLLGTKITSTYRLPASFFVTISYMCWAFRRHKMIVSDEEVYYE